jgi:hypothetical protein
MPVAGLYVATNPDSPYQIGCSGDLARRLTDGEYTTLFPRAWTYALTIGVAHPPRPPRRTPPTSWRRARCGRSRRGGCRATRGC